MSASLQLRLGDSLEILRSLTSESVQCCVTSPPYWGLRDYGAAGQVGLEKTPDEYVARLVDIFSEVRRVLTKDGTLWLNLGDCYATGAGKARIPGGKHNGNIEAYPRQQPNRMPLPGLKPKDLIGIPWMVAFALRTDGWWLRSEIIWHKTNPMPSSVSDRPTLAHEQIFLLTKAQSYYYDHKAIREEAKFPKGPWGGRNARPGVDTNGGNQQHGVIRASTPYRNKRTVWTVATAPFKGAHFATYPPKLIQPCILASTRPGDLVLDPFNGAGTTGLVALQAGRRYLGIDINPAYLDLTRERLAEVSAS